MPRAAPAGTSAKVHVAERDPPPIPSDREINPDGHNRSIKRINSSSGRRARDNEVGVRPGKPHPINHHLSKVRPIRHHESIPCGRLPQRDHHRRCNTIVLHLPPHPAHHPIGAMYPSDLSVSRIRECIHSLGPTAPMSGIKPIAHVIRIRWTQIDRMRSEPVLQLPKILPAEAGVVRDKQLLKLVREGALLHRDPLHRERDAVLQPEPEKLPRQCVKLSPRTPAVYDP